MTWPISYKANLLSRIAGGLSARAVFIPAGDSSQRLRFLLCRKAAFFSEPDSLKMLEEDALALLIRDYVLGDSTERYSSIELLFHDEKDSISCSRMYPTGSIPVDHGASNSQSWLYRMARLANVVPFGYHIIMDSTRRYKRRFVGFTLGGSWHTADKQFYSICLASVIFDYVLARDPNRFYHIIVVPGVGGESMEKIDPLVFIGCTVGFNTKDAVLGNIREHNDMVLARDFQYQNQ